MTSWSKYGEKNGKAGPPWVPRVYVRAPRRGAMLSGFDAKQL